MRYLSWWLHLKEIALRSWGHKDGLRNLFNFKKNLYVFKRDRERTYKFPKINALGKEGRHSLPLCPTRTNKPLTFYLSLHNTASSPYLGNMLPHPNWEKGEHRKTGYLPPRKNESPLQFDWVNLAKKRKEKRKTTHLLS